MHVLVALGAFVRLVGLLAVVERWQEVSDITEYCQAIEQ